MFQMNVSSFLLPLLREGNNICVYNIVYIFYRLRSNAGKAVLPVWFYPDKALETYI